LEDEIEVERQKKVAELKAKGIAGTPVTPETFAIWQDKKRQQRAEQAKKLVEAEFKKKKGGKGLAVLSGRDLYEYKKDLFQINDDDVIDEGEEQQQEQPQPPPNGMGIGTTATTTSASATTTATDGQMGNNNDIPSVEVQEVVEKVQTDLFLAGDDDDLDDLEDDE
jgi:LAS superfamily LD-carboxypeptidase LdcB